MTNNNYIAIYRRFRPEVFDEVLGQEHVTRVLQTQIRENSLAHAYLFSGTRGTGKTTIARLLAKGVNCLAGGNDSKPASDVLRPCGVCENCKAIKNGVFVDVVEIDAASNNSVEDVRELRDSVMYPPVSGRKKVFIIDEVHMFSKSAFNALLKTLEEPPPHVMFILATTELGKLPATILSRCLRFDFKRVSTQEIMRGMKMVVKELGLTMDDDAAALLAANADGSVRDGFSLLEQCVSSNEKHISRNLLLELLGSPSDEQLALLTQAAFEKKTTDALVLLSEILAAGKDEQRVISEWITYFHAMLLIKFVKRPERIINRSIENIEQMRKQAEAIAPAFINENIYRLSQLLNDARWSSHTRILLEMAVIEMSERGLNTWEKE
ncbi:MAG: DNA polymerase III subunit gamma/tau [Clostridiales Family XIII bacterium]|nr:DNA polymerase III subunit gamma/tau [Clostridiales Family XIII bacterium]